MLAVSLVRVSCSFLHVFWVLGSRLKDVPFLRQQEQKQSQKYVMALRLMLGCAAFIISSHIPLPKA